MTGILAQMLAITLCFLVFYFLVIRPERSERLAQIALARRMEPGWLLITTHGMRGVVTALDPEKDLYEVEISPGVRISLLAQGIAEAFPPHTARVVEIGEKAEGPLSFPVPPSA